MQPSTVRAEVLAALTAAAALATCLLLRSSRFAEDRSSDASGDDVSEDQPKGYAKPLKDVHQKLFKAVEERWSSETATWTEFEHSDSASSSDSYIFIVRTRRSHSRQPNSEPEVVISVYSSHLAAVLRHLLKDDDNVYADVPELKANDVFLVVDDLKKTRDGVKKKAKWLGDGKVGEGENDGGDSEGEVAEGVTKEDAKAEARTGEPTQESDLQTGESAKGDTDNNAVNDSESPACIPAESREDLEATADALDVLIGWIEKAYASTQSKLSRMLPTKQISFNLLWYLLHPGVKAITVHENTRERLGILITSSSYQHLRSKDESFFYVVGTHLEFNGEAYQRTCNILSLIHQSRMNLTLRVHGHRYFLQNQ